MAGAQQNASSRAARPARRLAGTGLLLRAGLVLLVLLFVYLAAASLWPPRPGSPPGTPGTLYAHALLKVLLGLLVLSLTCAMALRIPLRWATLGAWLAHAGVLVLAGGAAWYTARHVSGVAVAARDAAAGPFRRVERFFLDDTAAVYVTAAGEGASGSAQTPLKALPRSRESVPLRIGVESPFDDVAITAAGYLPAAMVALEWRDDGPAEIGAVEVVIHDGPHDFRRVLCPAYPFCREFDAGPYAVLYAPSLRGLGGPAALGRPDVPAGKEAALIAPAGGDAADIAVIGPGGAGRGVQRVVTAKQIKLTLGGRELGLTVVRFFTRAWLAGVASRARVGQAPAAVRLDVTVGEWRGSHWVRFDPYVRPLAPADPGLQRLPLPGGRTAYFHFAPQSRPLARPFGIKRLDYRTYPGSEKALDYSCLLEVAAPPGGRPKLVECRLNRPAAVGELRVHQNTWSPSPQAPEEIVFLVASRPGIRAVWLGCILVCLGLPYAFYVKPLLLRRRRRAAS